MVRSVLVLNSGSSSLKYALYNLKQSAICISKGVIEGIGSSRCSISHKNLQVGQNVKMQGNAVVDHSSGLKKVLELLHLDKGHTDNVYAVGHRVVHGGEQLTKPVLVTNDVKKAIEKAVPLAPLHNPSNLEGIRVAEELLACPQVAVFDTAFHSTLPPHAYMYALPYSYYKELGLRRYGFHGTNYDYILGQVAEHLAKPKGELNVIACHLGAGASLAAIKDGACIDTSMGVTPLEGLVMATRSGDIDPAIFEILESSKGMSISQISNMLNKESGIYGICGEKDMRTVIELSEAGSEKHKLALQVYVHRIRKYLGAYYLNLGGRVDALLFSGGVGEKSSSVRQMVCSDLEMLGLIVDQSLNQAGGNGLREIQAETSRIKVLIVPADEELAIAQQTLEVVQGSTLAKDGKRENTAPASS
ncbi:hypothetical protein GOP47_0006950 [Adiantum capillus-veneris]|uniref:Probable acetate kinase n=1 Tax=Adiantum capillus-veneris TaxID=13818 RepID=A0A9D4ZL23_ADICA|nr:hypothetical protein GOP47_0006950 [Adiantum capillus-veneris]